MGAALADSHQLPEGERRALLLSVFVLAGVFLVELLGRYYLPGALAVPTEDLYFVLFQFVLSTRVANVGLY